MGFDTLIVLLSDPPEPVLDSHGRAELVAALDMIDYVVLAQKRSPGVEFDRKTDISVFREEAADEARFQRLLEMVRQRHLPVSG